MKQIVKERKDIAFYLIMYPAAHPQAKDAIDYALCAKSNKERLERFEKSFDKKPTPKAECDKDVVPGNMEYGRKNMISGTPTIFLEDGSRLGGALEKEDLLKAIDATSGRK
jgi:thiol:disulfide interchange protein DsbC